MKSMTTTKRIIVFVLCVIAFVSVSVARAEETNLQKENIAEIADHLFFGYNQPADMILWVVPVKANDWYITQRIHASHNGVDIAVGRCGGEIIAAANGVITGVHNYGSFGKFIIIRHKFNVHTVYAHLSQIQVKRGDIVLRGETIGLMGSTGKSTGCHLHFEIWGTRNYMNNL